MARTTLAQAESQLALWVAASSAVATGQSYTIGNRSLTRANAKEIRENIVFWNKQVKRLTRGGSPGQRSNARLMEKDSA